MLKRHVDFLEVEEHLPKKIRIDYGTASLLGFYHYGSSVGSVPC